MQGDEIQGRVGCKVGAGFSISGNETHGNVCMTGRNDTPGRVDIISRGESDFTGAKKAGGHLLFALV